MGKNRIQDCRAARIIFGDERNTQKYPWVNFAILVYTGIVLAVKILFLISPFVTLVSGTPFSHLQSYLGILGGGLLCVDLFTNKVLWRGPYVLLLYGLCLVAVISSLLTISYGISDNLYIICWTAIEFALFYSLASRTSPDKLKKYVKYVYLVLLAIWFVACCVSLFQYVFQIGYWYVVDPLADDSSPARQGFIEHRLFGIFNPLNHAVFVSVVLLLIGIYFIIRVKRGSGKAILSLMNAALLFHIILSGSRSAQVALLACSLVLFWMLAGNKLKHTGVRRILISGAAACILTAVCVLAFVGIKSVLAQVPKLVVPTEASQIQNNTITESSASPVTTAESDTPEEAPALVSKEPEATESVQVETEPPAEQAEKDNLLQREGLEDDVSNDRFKIWKDYISLYQEIGLLGLSPGNYMPYIQEHHPEKYIVSYVLNKFPEKFAGGTIYHVHNGYLMVFVSTGFVGVLLMAAYIALFLAKTVSYIRREKMLSYEYIFAMLIVIAVGISALFDKGVFFMDNPSTFVFWAALGIVMRENCGKTRKPAASPEKKER